MSGKRSIYEDVGEGEAPKAAPTGGMIDARPRGAPVELRIGEALLIRLPIEGGRGDGGAGFSRLAPATSVDCDVVPMALHASEGGGSTAAAPEHGYSALRPCITSSLWIPDLPFPRNMLEWVGASVMASSAPAAAAAAVGASSSASVSAPMGQGGMDMTITPRQYTEAGGAPELPDWLSPPSQRPISPSY